MEVKINLIEVAAELAEIATTKEILNLYPEDIKENTEEYNKIYKIENNVRYYTEEAQQIFEKHYDFYFDFIETRKI